MNCIPVFSLLIPFLTQLAAEKKESENKKRILTAGIVAAAVNCGILLLWLVFRDAVSGFEYLYANSVISLLVVFLGIPLLRDRKLEHTAFLKTICLISVATAIYSNLTYGQTQIHADSATSSLLTKAQWETRDFFPDGWCYGNGDVWVITVQTFAAPFILLMEDQSLARVLGSSFLLAVVCWLIYQHSRRDYKDDSWMIAVPIFLLFLTGDIDMILYQSAYATHMLFQIVGMMLVYRIYTRKAKPWQYGTFAVFMVLLLMGGIRCAAESAIPLWGTCIVVDYLQLRKQQQPDWKAALRNWIRMTAVVMIPAFVGILIYRRICATHTVINSMHNSLLLAGSMDVVIDNFFKYISNLFGCFGFRGGAYLLSADGIMSMVSIVMCLIVVLIVPVLQAVRLKQESRYVQFFFTFAVVHNLLMFVMTVIFAEKTKNQYLLTSIFCLILLSARYIYVYWIRQKHFEKYLWTGLFVAVVLLRCLLVGFSSMGWQTSLAEKEEITQTIEEHGLTKGYGDFWYALGYEVYSDFDLRFAPLEITQGQLVPFAWLVDATVFEPQEGNTFLLLSEAENAQVAPNLPDLLKEPIDYFTVNGSHIYVFDYDIIVDLQD